MCHNWYSMEREEQQASVMEQQHEEQDGEKTGSSREREERVSRREGWTKHCQNPWRSQGR